MLPNFKRATWIYYVLLLILKVCQGSRCKSSHRAYSLQHGNIPQVGIPHVYRFGRCTLWLSIDVSYWSLSCWHLLAVIYFVFRNFHWFLDVQWQSELNVQTIGQVLGKHNDYWCEWRKFFLWLFSQAQWSSDKISKFVWKHWESPIAETVKKRLGCMHIVIVDFVSGFWIAMSLPCVTDTPPAHWWTRCASLFAASCWWFPLQRCNKSVNLSKRAL